MGLIDYQKTGHLVTITLNRPEKLNAMNLEMLSELREAWIRYRDDEGAWLALLTGAGRAFSAGADIEDIKLWADSGRFFPEQYLATIAKDPFFAGELDKPTIAAVNGYALGGGFDLVLRADLRLAAESAVFGIPEVELGGVLLFWDNLPYALAAEILTGATISARRAYEMGIVNKVVADGETKEKGLELAEELLRKPPLALRSALRALRQMKRNTSPLSRSLELEYASLLGYRLSNTEDGKKAIRAAGVKLKPDYNAD
jgi:enoyl-CoA hydratase/carnithine racemase